MTLGKEIMLKHAYNNCLERNWLSKAWIWYQNFGKKLTVLVGCVFSEVERSIGISATGIHITGDSI